MPDILDQIFGRIHAEPDPAFVDALHRRALAELLGEPVVGGHVDPDAGADTPPTPEADVVAHDALDAGSRRRRRLMTAVALVAGVAAATVLAFVGVDRESPPVNTEQVTSTSISSTTVPPTTVPTTTLAPGSKPVPRVKGLTRDQAKAAVEAAGFVYAGKGEDLAPCPAAGILTAWDSAPAVDVVAPPGATVTVRYYCPRSRFVDATG